MIRIINRKAIVAAGVGIATTIALSWLSPSSSQLQRVWMPLVINDHAMTTPIVTPWASTPTITPTAMTTPTPTMTAISDPLSDWIWLPSNFSAWNGVVPSAVRNRDGTWCVSIAGRDAQGRFGQHVFRVSPNGQATWIETPFVPAARGQIMIIDGHTWLIAWHDTNERLVRMRIPECQP